ncbi:MAG: hypothetical protein R2864_03760 [Syntrophotaleaceae bacterium]
MTAAYMSLADQLTVTVQAFRLGMEGQANENFAGLIDALGGVLEEASPLKMNELSQLLPEILSAQNRQDYLGLADLLAYRLAPLLGLS